MCIRDSDKGESGLRNAIKFWKSKNVVFCGAYLDEEDYKTIPTNTVKGIKFAYVGLTEPTNGLSLPEGSKTILMLGADEDKMCIRDSFYGLHGLHSCFLSADGFSLRAVLEQGFELRPVV